MVERHKLSCSSCRALFYARVGTVISCSAEIAFFCPHCRSPIRGTFLHDFVHPDGSAAGINIQSMPRIRFVGAAPIQYETTESFQGPVVSVYVGLPITQGLHVAAFRDGFVGPNIFTAQMLGNRAPAFTAALEMSRYIPDADLNTLFNAVRLFFSREYDSARRCVVQLAPDGTAIEVEHRLLSVIAQLHNLPIVPLVPEFKAFPAVNQLIANAANNRHALFAFYKFFSASEIHLTLLKDHLHFVHELIASRDLLIPGTFILAINNHRIERTLISTQGSYRAICKLYLDLCEDIHRMIKLLIGYSNVVRRADFNSFARDTYRSFPEFMARGKLYESLSLIQEHPELFSFFNNHIEKHLRNAIAHNRYSISPDYQSIQCQDETRSFSVRILDISKRISRLASAAPFASSILTDIHRLVMDHREGRF